MSSDDLESSVLAKMLTATGLATGTPRAQPPQAWFASTDVVHIHNTFPAISHEWLGEVAVPKVITAHNYRAFCANGLFLRNGVRCMDCTTRGSSRAVIHGCYRNSHAKSIPIAMQQSSSRSLSQLMSCCHRVLLPGQPMEEIFNALGVANTQVLFHPVTEKPTTSAAGSPRNAWLFVGRISPEKGLVDLLGLWPSSRPLMVIGEGPDRRRAESLAIERGLAVQFLGSRSSNEVQSLMSRSRGLIFPSRALEGAPLVYGEAMQAGLPLVATEGSTFATQTMVDRTGALFTWDDPGSLNYALDLVDENHADLVDQARVIYESRYTPDKWINNITEIYKAAIFTHGNK